MFPVTVSLKAQSIQILYQPEQENLSNLKLLMEKLKNLQLVEYDETDADEWRNMILEALDPSVDAVCVLFEHEKGSLEIMFVSRQRPEQDRRTMLFALKGYLTRQN